MLIKLTDISAALTSSYGMTVDITCDTPEEQLLFVPGITLVSYTPKFYPEPP